MAHEHVQDLKKARSALVALRRTWAKAIAAPGAKEGTINCIIEVQQAIEAIDRAIKDEEQ
jgi:hypothetical protein